MLRHLQIQPIQGIGLPAQGLGTDGVRLLLLGNGLNGAAKVRLRLGKLSNSAAADTGDQHPQIFRLVFQNLLDLYHRSHGVQVRKPGIIHQQVLLGHQKQRLVLLHGLFQGQNGLCPAYIKMDGLLRKNRQAPQREDGEFSGVQLFFFQRVSPPFTKKGVARYPLTDYRLPERFSLGCAGSRMISGSPPSTASGVMTTF